MNPLGAWRKALKPGAGPAPATERPSAPSSVPVRAMPLPSRLVLPLADARQAVWRPCVAPGSVVHRGQEVAQGMGRTRAPATIGEPRREGAAAVEPYARAPLHAPTSGTVGDPVLLPAPHPSGTPVPCLTLEPDGNDTRHPPLPPLALETAAPSALLARIHACGVRGMGGGCFPTARKLQAGREAGVDTLIVNAVECDTHLAVDARLLAEDPEAVAAGARAAAQACGARHAFIALKQEQAASLAGPLRNAGAGSEGEPEVVTVSGVYPSGYEPSVVRAVTGRTVPEGERPPAVGVVCINAATAAAVHRAVARGRPCDRRIVTVGGDALPAPVNVEVAIGTPLRALAAFCGVAPGALEAEGGLIWSIGPRMMALRAVDDGAPVLHGTAGVWIETREPETWAPQRPCIRCGACAERCPVDLQPQELYWYLQGDLLDEARARGLERCIHCGACSAVCPSAIPLAAWFRHGNDEIDRQEAERAEAEEARRRYEQRQERVARRRAAIEEEQRRKREAARENPEARKAAVAAAAARARRRKGRDPT